LSVRSPLTFNLRDPAATPHPRTRFSASRAKSTVAEPGVIGKPPPSISRPGNGRAEPCRFVAFRSNGQRPWAPPGGTAVPDNPGPTGDHRACRPNDQTSASRTLPPGQSEFNNRSFDELGLHLSSQLDRRSKARPTPQLIALRRMIPAPRGKAASPPKEDQEASKNGEGGRAAPP